MMITSKSQLKLCFRIEGQSIQKWEGSKSSHKGPKEMLKFVFNKFSLIIIDISINESSCAYAFSILFTNS